MVVNQRSALVVLVWLTFLGTGGCYLAQDNDFISPDADADLISPDVYDELLEAESDVIKDSEVEPYGDGDTVEDPGRVKSIKTKIPADGGSCLTVHNKYRALHHQTPPLKWSAGLASEAQAYANKMAKTSKFEHAKGTRQGENLYWRGVNLQSFKNKPITCENMIRGIKLWYEEIAYYDWSKAGFKLPREKLPKKLRKNYRKVSVGHFTQLVWRSSEKLGMGAAVGDNGKLYVVARYYPQGNIWLKKNPQRKYENNVLPLRTVRTKSV